MSYDEVRAGLDGCEGDDVGLKTVIAGATLLYSNHYDERYEHSYDDIYRLPDGQYLHVSCGGCSCGGTFDFRVLPTREEALKYVPEDKRDVL